MFPSAPRHPAFSQNTEPLAVFNQTLNPCRPDLSGFVNGLPLVVIELKKAGVSARAAFDENLTHYRERIDTSPLIPLPIRCGEGDAVLVQRAVYPRTARTVNHVARA